jgi:hypothetical protein
LELVPPQPSGLAGAEPKSGRSHVQYG